MIWVVAGFVFSNGSTDTWFNQIFFGHRDESSLANRVDFISL